MSKRASKKGGTSLQSDGPLPASDTKHLGTLSYPIASLGARFELTQLPGDGITTGFSLWLSSQILACYLQANPKLLQKAARRSEGSQRAPRVIDLGAGIGLLTLLMSRMGADVLATDVDPPLSGVLLPNIEAHKQQLQGHGTAVGRKLDWCETPLDDEAAAKALSELALQAGVAPPWDLIVTTDTLYHSDLIDPLFRTILALVRASRAAQAGEAEADPAILVALERRDSALIDTALQRAAEHGFALSQVPLRTLRKAVDQHLGATWPREDWAGVEVWEFKVGKGSLLEQEKKKKATTQ